MSSDEPHLRPPLHDDARVDSTADAAALGFRNPWERREELGRTPAFFRALKQIALAPTQTFDGTAPRGGYRGPLLFALFVSLVAGLLSGLTETFYELSVSREASGGLTGLFDLAIEGERVEGLGWIPASVLSLVSAGGCIVGLLVGIPLFLIFLPVVVFIWSGVLHLCLRMVGGLRHSEAGYEGTWATVCYAMVGIFGEAVPVIGEWISFLWLGVLQAIGFWRLHRTSLPRAFAALLLPFALVALLLLLQWAGWIGPAEGVALEPMRS